MGIRKLLNERIIICDGAMGTMMQKYGLAAGDLPEMLTFTQPEILSRIYGEYLHAGSDFICTNTFGANRIKMEGTGRSVDEIITSATLLAKNAIKKYQEDLLKTSGCTGTKADSEMSKYVALDLSSVGKLMKPAGDMTFEEACDIYRELIIPALKAGVDLILFETYTDLYELKAAAVTARELTDLPVFCSVTVQENGRMMMGADVLTVVNTLQDLGIDAIGLNCSLGPKQMIQPVNEMLKYSRLPVLVQPNAGLPRIKNGCTVYDVNTDEFTQAMKEMILSGVSIVGGCCGTTPDYIRSLSECVKSIGNTRNRDSGRAGKHQANAGRHSGYKPFTAASSATRTVIFDDKIRVIGERINPTGKKHLKQALKEKNFTYIENEAVSQVKAGAEILDINTGLPEIDELQTMKEVLERVSAVVDAPLQIDSADPKVLEAAVREYNGRPVINSVNGKQDVMDAVFPIVKKYGTCVVALTLDEKGLPANTEERIAIAEKIINEAAKYGIGRERIIIDCLTLTVSAGQSTARDALNAIRQVKSRFGVKTTLGASNISFGLPERKLLNRTFLAMALEAGLDAPITDPLMPEYMDTIRAFEALSGKDADCGDYIKQYGTQIAEGNNTGNFDEIKIGSGLADIIINGYTDRAAGVTAELLKTMKPLEIVEQIIIPSLESVGRDYETGEKFLPQLIHSADTVKKSFDVIKAAMKTAGDGYEVIDLGKDTDIDLIVQTAVKENIKLVGLSALMTTTVVSMEKTINALHEAGADCRIAVGGAVLNPEYAEEIKADYYCKDAMDAVRVANSIFKGE